MDTKRRFNLPDDTVTYDQNRYVDAWRELADAVQRRIPGLRRIGYDPGILFEDLYSSHTVDLPTRICIAISKLQPAKE